MISGFHNDDSILQSGLNFVNMRVQVYYQAFSPIKYYLFIIDSQIFKIFKYKSVVYIVDLKPPDVDTVMDVQMQQHVHLCAPTFRGRSQTTLTRRGG